MPVGKVIQQPHGNLTPDADWHTEHTITAALTLHVGAWSRVLSQVKYCSLVNKKVDIPGELQEIASSQPTYDSA